MNKELEKLKALDVDAIEIKSNKDISNNITIENGKLLKNEINNSENYTLSLLKNNMSINTSCENKKLFLKEAAKALNDLKYIDSKDENDFNKNNFIKSKKRKDISLEECKKEILDNYSKLLIPKEVYNITIDLFKSYKERGIVNSYNLDLFESYNNNYISIEVDVKNNDKYAVSYKTERINNPLKIIQDTIDESIDKLNIVSVESKKYNIIIKNNALTSLFNSFIKHFSYLLVDNNLSIFKDKIDKKIFSDKITLVEEPTHKMAYIKHLFDNEGTITNDKIIIDKGVLKTYLYNIKMAKKVNYFPTGNSFDNLVNNAYIKKGNTSLDGLIKNNNNGLLITELHGLHAGINHSNGDFSLQAEGYVIKNNKKSKYVDNLIVSSNIFDLFSNIIDIGSDLVYKNSSFNCPSILFKNISISSKKES